MFDYVKDKKFLSCIRNVCGEIMQDFCHYLKEDYDIGSIFYLVGSGARNLIVQNASLPIDLDYNLEIVKCKNYKNCRYIKECARKSFNKALNKHDWKDCEDSKSSLTTKKRHFVKGNTTEFSMDICITYKDTEEYLHRLIHKKTGNTHFDRYCWNKAFNSIKIDKKAKHIKKSGKWELVRTEYLNVKRKYLHQNDYKHSSLICYIEAVNNVYNSITN